MSKTVFNFNTPVSAEWFNNINGNRLRFDGNPNFPNNLVDGQYYPIRKQDLDPSVLADFSQSKDVVTTNTDQIVGGNKIFSEPLSIPNGSNNTHAVTKAQLDAVALGLSGATAALDFVNRTANQSIDGIKTFVKPIIIPNGVDPSHAISKFQLDATAVKLTSDQTIAGVKTFASPVLIPPGSVPGAAVNYAQLLAGIADKNQYGAQHIVFPNGLKIKWSTRIGDNSQSQYHEFNFTFNEPPVVVVTMIEPNQTTTFAITDVTTVGFRVWFRQVTTPNISGNLNYIAIGY